MDIDGLRELFAPFGVIDCRRMFGGVGIYRDKAMFALEADGEIYLKAGPEDEAAFIAAGARPFLYPGKPDANGKAKLIKLGYWSLPVTAFDDPDELCAWADRAWRVARAAADKKVAMLTKLRVTAEKA